MVEAVRCSENQWFIDTPRTAGIDDWRDNTTISEGLNVAVRQLQAAALILPRDGDYCRSSIEYPHLYKQQLSAMVGNDLGARPERKLILLSLLRIHISIITTKARYAKAKQDYALAKALYQEALDIYEALLDPNKENISKLRVPSNPDKCDPSFDLINYANQVIPNGLKTNLKLTRDYLTTEKSIPKINDMVEMMKEDMANVKLQILIPDDVFASQSVYTRLTEQGFRQITGQISRAANTARESLTDEMGAGRAFYNHTRSYVFEASFYLEMAKRLSVRNIDFAIDAIDLTIKICLDILKIGIKPEYDTSTRDLVLSFITILAWAYGMRASLMNKQEPGSDEELKYAKKSAAIYTWLLSGNEALIKNPGLINSIPEINSPGGIMDRYSTHDEVWGIAAIARSFESIKKSGGIIIENYDLISTSRRFGFDKAPLDILKFNGTNEMEMYLNLANTLASARLYDDAIAEYDAMLGVIKKSEVEANFGRDKSWKQYFIETADGILSFRPHAEDQIKKLKAVPRKAFLLSLYEKHLLRSHILALQKSDPRHNRYPLRASFWARVQTSKANALLQQATRDHQKNKDTKIALERADEALRLATEAADALWPLICGDKGTCRTDLCDDFNIAAYLQAVSSMAWAYATKGNLLKAETGEGETELKKALSLYNAFHLQGARGAPPLQATIDSSSDKYSQRVDSILSTLKDGRVYAIQSDTGITIPEIIQRRAEVLANLEEYDEAVSLFGKIEPTDIAHSSAQISIKEIELIKAKRAFQRSWDIGQYLSDLNAVLTWINSLNPSNLNSIQRLRAKMLEAQILGTKGWLETQRFNRPEANKLFKDAIQVYDDLYNALTDKISTAEARALKYALNEMNITPGQLKLTLAELEKIRYERSLDQEEIKEFLASTSEVIFRSQKEGNKQSVIQAIIIQAEAATIRAKLQLKEEKLAGARAFLDGPHEELLKDAVKKALELGSLRLAFRAAQALASLLGVKGGIKEALDGEGQGREFFLKAADILLALLGDEAIDALHQPSGEWAKLLDMVRGKSEIFKSEDFLLLHDTSEAQIKLNIAELTKSAAVRISSNTGGNDSFYKTLEEAQKGYEAASDALLKVPKTVSDRLGHALKLAAWQAKIGAAENQIAHAEALVEDNQAERDAIIKKYQDALSEILLVVNSITGLGNIETVDLAALYLRAIKALAWAINSWGGMLKENSQTADDDDPPQFKAALLIYRALIERDLTSALVKELWEDPQVKKWAPSQIPALDQITKHLADNSQKLLSKEILFATDTNSSSLKLDYVLTLISAEMYEEALIEYRKVTDELAEKPKNGVPLTLKETEMLAEMHTAIGDVICFKLKRTKYGEAKKIYDKAMELMKNIDLAKPENKKFLELYLKIKNGYGKILADNQDYDGAIKEYKEITQHPAFSGLDPQSGFGNIDKKLPKIYVSAKLSIADIYNYKLKDRKNALALYKEAGLAAKHIPTARDKKRFIAQACLGVGNVYRLRDRDFEEAVRFYDLAINILERMQAKAGTLDRDSRELLVQLYISKSATLGEDGNATEALELLEKANALVEFIRKKDSIDIRRSIEQAEDDIQNSRFDRLSEIILNVMDRKSTYTGANGISSTSGGLASSVFVSLKIPATKFEITASAIKMPGNRILRGDTPSQNDSTIEGINRVTVEATLKGDITSDLNLSGGMAIISTTANTTINDDSHLLSRIFGSRKRNHDFSSLGLTAKGEGNWNIFTSGRFYSGLGGRIFGGGLLHSDLSPYLEDQFVSLARINMDPRRSEEQTKQLIASKRQQILDANRDSRFLLGSEAFLRLGVPGVFFALGLGAKYDRLLDFGLYPLKQTRFVGKDLAFDEQSFGSIYALMQFNATAHLGTQRFDLSFNGTFGSNNNLSAISELWWRPSFLPFGTRVGVNASYFRFDQSSNSTLGAAFQIPLF